MIYIPKEFESDPVISAVAENKQLLPYQVIEKSDKWISAGLQSEMDTWEHFSSRIVTNLKPVFITAATGAGKTTFVIKELVKRAAKLGSRVLLLNNRWALNFQQKISKSKEDGIDLGSTMTDSLKEIGNLLCYTYHEAYHNLQSIVQGDWIEFVVFDEVHFFTADSTFNSETSLILQRLMRTFWRSRRIYMTATPEEIKPIIALEEYRLNAENVHIGNPTGQMMDLPQSGIIEYKFPIDYASRIRLHFFDGVSDKPRSNGVWPDIVDAIKADKTDEKWLIFVSTKDLGKKLQEALKGVSAKCIDASYRKNKRIEVMDLARRAMFQEKVLIATSFLYNGISFHDPLLKNIVTDYANQESIIQALGRKRIDSDEKVNLYIRLQSDHDLKTYRDEINTLFRLTQDFLASHSNFLMQRWDNLSSQQRQMFSPVLWTPNDLARDIQYRLTQIQLTEKGTTRNILEPKMFSEESNALKLLLETYTAVWERYSYIFNGEMFRNVGFIMSDYAPYHLGKLAGSYEQIMDEFAQGNENAFQEEVCRWLGLDYEETMEFAVSKRKERQAAYFDEIKMKVVACVEKYQKLSPLDENTLQEFESELKETIGDSKLVKFRDERDKNGRNRRTNANICAVLSKFYPTLTCRIGNKHYHLEASKNDRPIHLKKQKNK